ncbi:MAG: methyltransferase domain-containing protein [Lentisphaeria bacterium]|nr:methyltransferase domain-containing protein [Lentisphaeria bacterium]
MSFQYTAGKRRRNPNSQELGLRIANIFGRYFLKTEHLHYGFWPDGLPVTLENLPQAQDLYTEFLRNNIPDGVSSILDIGCGTGHNAEVLLANGYSVDCVSPSPYLSGITREKIRNRGSLYECIFENLPAGRKYDCLLFSESFQYIDLDTVFSRMPEFLNPGGYVIISDFFRIPGEGSSAMGGGHRLSRFRDKLASSGFSLQKEQDVTENTAPNLQLVDEALQQVAVPIRDLVIDELSTRHRWAWLPGRWLGNLFFRRRLDKLDYKYFSGSRNAQNFREHKRYCLFVLKLEQSFPLPKPEPKRGLNLRAAAL